MMMFLLSCLPFLMGVESAKNINSKKVLISQHEETHGSLPSGYDGAVETEHSVIVWKTNETTEEEIAAAKSVTEESFAGLRAYLGESKSPKKKLIIILDGDGLLPDYRAKVPHVDSFGRIYVYRFPGRGYTGELTHEMVHAFRRVVGIWYDGFIEEGFAEFLAIEVNPNSNGFPRYGYPLTVVAGQWLATDEEIPLTLLMQDHSRLNLKCKWQTYPLRASFINYLNETFQTAALLKFVYGERPNLMDYEKFFGQTIEQLYVAWRKDLLAKFSKSKNAPQKAKEYRETTPAQYMHPCQAGQDF